MDKLFQVPCVCLTRVNDTIDSLDRSLAHNNRASLADVLLSSEVQVYKSIVISSSYDRSVHDRYYTITRGNNPTSTVLTLVHAKSQLTRSMSRLTRANEFIKTIPSNQWYTSTELGIDQSICVLSNSKQDSYTMRITTSLLIYNIKQVSYSTRITTSLFLSKLICGAIASRRTSFYSHHVAMAQSIHWIDYHWC